MLSIYPAVFRLRYHTLQTVFATGSLPGTSYLFTLITWMAGLTGLTIPIYFLIIWKRMRYSMNCIKQNPTLRSFTCGCQKRLKFFHSTLLMDLKTIIVYLIMLLQLS